jgi:cytochrome c
MSNLSFNKIAGAGLATALAIVGLREVTTGLFSSEPPAKPGYLIEAATEGGEGAAAADVLPDFGTVIPAADPKAGEAVFAKCQSCHNAANGGANGTGPNLWGIVGHKPGSHAGFAYSAGMTEFGGKQGVWDDTHLYEFLKAPQKYISGTKMSFVGLKKSEDRINLIAYLRTQGGTLPMPAPNPAAAAPAVVPAGAAAAPAGAAAAPAAGAAPAAPAGAAPAAAVKPAA